MGKGACTIDDSVEHKNTSTGKMAEFCKQTKFPVSGVAYR